MKSIDTWAACGRQVMVVANPSECNDFKHLVGSTVNIDGEDREVIGVEFLAHGAPFKKGEPIGLMVKE